MRGEEWKGQGREEWEGREGEGEKGGGMKGEGKESKEYA